MLKNPTSVRRLLIIVVLGLVIFVAIGSYLLLSKSSEDENKSDNGEETSAIDENGLLELNDATYPELEAVLNNQDKTLDDKYNELFSFGSGKESFGRYDEALSYYEAALNVLEDGDAERREYIQYVIYLMAQKSDNSNLENKYKNLLGEDKINEFKKRAQEYENNR